LILLGFLLLFPLLALTAYLISVTRADVATTKAEIKGVRAVEAITSAVALVQEHRDQLNILLVLLNNYYRKLQILNHRHLVLPKLILYMFHFLWQCMIERCQYMKKFR
jgi:hypothetical protein